MAIDWMLLVAFFFIVLLYFVRKDSHVSTEHFSNTEPALQSRITKKDKVPTCSEASIAYTQIMRYIADDISGDGAILLRNFRDIFFEVDEECLKSRTCSPISVKKSLDPSNLYNEWTNPLTCLA
jgi:hypothetical protein